MRMRRESGMRRWRSIRMRWRSKKVALNKSCMYVCMYGHYAVQSSKVLCLVRLEHSRCFTGLTSSLIQGTPRWPLARHKLRTFEWEQRQQENNAKGHLNTNGGSVPINTVSLHFIWSMTLLTVSYVLTLQKSLHALKH